MIKKLDIKDNYRLLVISDIHGGLELLQDIMNMIDLQEEDYLIVLGDFLEKGTRSRDTLEYIRKLDRRERTYILKGNNEEFILRCVKNKDFEEIVQKYLKNKTYPSLLDEYIEESGIPADTPHFQEDIYQRYKDDFDYLASKLVGLELDQFIFVHAGIENIPDWRETTLHNLLYLDNFYHRGHSQDKYVVVGHWPCSNYKTDSLSNRILMDHEKKIISIDGGYGVKFTGQVNCLEITKTDGSIAYKEYNSDYFEPYELLEDTEGARGDIKIGWPNNKVEVLHMDGEFIPCKVEGSEKPVHIKKEFLKKDEEGNWFCDHDFVSNFLSGKKGDIIGFLGAFGSYSLVKSNNDFHWVPSDKINKVK